MRIRMAKRTGTLSTEGTVVDEEHRGLGGVR